MSSLALALSLLVPLFLQESPVEGLFHVPVGKGEAHAGFIRAGSPEDDGFFRGGPQAFRVGADGFFHLGDPVKRRLLKFDAMGRFAGTLRPAGREGFLPLDFALDGASGVIVYERSGRRILRLGASGEVLAEVAAPYDGGDFGFVEWLEALPDGRIFVKDRDRGAIVALGADGAALGGVRTDAPSFALDPAGNLFYVERDATGGFAVWSYALGRRPFRTLDLGLSERSACRAVAQDASGRLFLIAEGGPAGRTLLAVDAAGMLDFERPLPALDMLRPVLVTAAGTIYFASFDETLEKGSIRIFRFK